MARRKKSRTFRGHRIPKIPLAVALPLVGWLSWGLGPMLYEEDPRDKVVNSARALARSITGYDFGNQTWNFDNIKIGLLPIIAGCLVHKFVGGKPLNLNRYFKDIPYVNI